MFFLYASAKNGPVILHVRGTINESLEIGFVDKEPIFLMAQKTSDLIEVIKQVGVVSIENNKPCFHYTDKDFKKSINYNEHTGYSTMDGGPWTILPTTYLHKNNMAANKLAPTKDNHMYMYSGAKNPLNNLSSILTSLLGQSFFNKTQDNDSNNKPKSSPSYGFH